MSESVPAGLLQPDDLFRLFGNLCHEPAERRPVVRGHGIEAHFGEERKVLLQIFMVFGHKVKSVQPGLTANLFHAGDCSSSLLTSAELLDKTGVTVNHQKWFSVDPEVVVPGKEVPDPIWHEVLNKIGFRSDSRRNPVGVLQRMANFIRSP